MNTQPVANFTGQIYNGSALQESRRLIDKKIAQLEQSILQLKSNRNELALISRLPPEILGTIFTFNSFQLGRIYDVRSIRTLVNFSYVCRMWRSVALNTPNIWCSIPFRNREWANTMLERSKTLDLFVDENFNYSSDTSPHVVMMKEVLKNHTVRIRGLCLTGLSSPMLSSLLTDLQPSSLRLRTLRLAEVPNGSSTPFPTGLLSNSEILQVLELIHCNFAWFSLRFAALTSLKIHGSFNRPSWADFVTVLQSVPGLEILDMGDSLPLLRGIRSARRTSTQTVKLMNLQKLSLCSTKSMREVSDVLSLIIVPQSAKLKFECTAGSTPGADFAASISDFTSALSIFFSGMDSGQTGNSCYKWLFVGSPENGQLAITLGRDDSNPGRNQFVSADLNLSITLHYPRPAEEVAQEILLILPIAKLVTLTMSADLDTETLVKAFGNLPQLQNITSVGGCTSNLLKALVYRPHDLSASQSISFPSLQSLEITDVIFSSDHEFRGGFSVECLQDCLIKRRESNFKIRTLSLADCFSLYEDVVEDLGDSVSEVEWDGFVQEYESDDESEDDEDEDEDMYLDPYYEYF